MLGATTSWRMTNKNFFFLYGWLWWVKVQEDLWILEFRIFLEERLGYKREKVRFMVVKRGKKNKNRFKKKNEQYK